MRTFISLNLSFRAVENRSFQTLVHMLNPESATELPGRTKFRDLLNQTYDTTLKNLITDRESLTKVSFAVDGWSSPNKLSFLGMNCYYISKDWKYRERLIGFEPLFGSHDGQNLGETVERIILEKNLEAHLLAITTDNASNNSTMRKEIADGLNRLHGVEWDKERGTIPCLAHVIQLVVKNLVSALKVEACNDSIPTSFNEDDINMVENVLTFENTLCKTSF